MSASANGNAPPVLGIDLGGTKILAAVVGPGSEVLGRSKRPTPAYEGGEAILRAILDAADEALAVARLKRDDIAAVGVGSPGPLDVETGTIIFSANMNVRNFALGPLLAAALRHPVIVQNDVRAGGYGEFRLGAGRGLQSLVAAFVGTGIGGFVVSGGQVVQGATGNAGEIGHIIVKAGGPKCGCGSRGCMEALASRTAITRRITKAIRKGIPTELAEKLTRRSGRLKSGELADAVAAGDHVATKEVRRAAHYLGLGLGSLINVLGPETVIIGGGVAEALGEPWVEMVRASARAQAITDPSGKLPIVLAALGDDAGILGAALLARERFLAAEPATTPA
jgi:glucokinase